MSLSSSSAPPVALPTLEVQAGVDVTVALTRASVGSRGAAYIADLLVLILVWLILILVVGLTIPFAELGATVLVGAVAGWFVTQWLYFGVQEAALGGQTVGKRLVGIRVVDSSGNPPGFGACLLRNVLRPVDALPTSYGIGTLLVAATSQGRRVGDLLAGTHVVHETTDEAELPELALPDGATEEERLLLEQWALRREVLHEDARERVAGRLSSWLDSRWPGFLQPGDTSESRIARALGLLPP